MAQYLHIWCVVSRGLGLKFTAVSEEDRPRLAALISRLRQLGKSHILKHGRGATEKLIHQSSPSRTKLPDRLASCRMDEPERLQLAARGLQFGKPAAFLLQQVILHSARTFGCFENVFPLS